MCVVLRFCFLFVFNSSLTNQFSTIQLLHRQKQDEGSAVWVKCLHSLQLTYSTQYSWVKLCIYKINQYYVQGTCILPCVFYVSIIIKIRNTYITPNPQTLAQSAPQFKTSMNINQNTKHAYTRQSNPTPTAKRRQTCTNPRTVNANKTCNAMVHGPWTHHIIANQMQRTS